MKNIDKAMRVTMPDGSKWDVHLVFVAHNRAAQYAAEGGEAFEREFEASFDDLDELRDWAEGNMNWSDVARYARCTKPPEMAFADYQEGWVNGEKEIVAG